MEPDTTSQSSYPVQFDVDYPDRELNRWSTAFRIFAAIPILYAGVRLWLKLEHKQPISERPHLADANPGATVAAPLEENR